MKRNIATIKQYDYNTKEAFLKDKEVMRNKGYVLAPENLFGYNEGVINTTDWHYTAIYIKASC
jgi:hypothetical protein